MPEAVKEWNRSKPFKRINNEKFLAQDPPDGFGTACGCKTPLHFPEMEKTFLDEFEKRFKSSGKFQSLIQKARKAVGTVGKGISTFNVIVGAAAAAGISLPAALVTAVGVVSKIQNVVDKALKITDETITEMIRNAGVALLRRAIRVLPQWVPVLRGASNKIVTPDQIIEVEGRATRSFMNPIDVPFRQWHLWFNWNIHVTPEPDYRKVTSPAPNPPHTPQEAVDEPNLRPIAAEGMPSIEVQWDAGMLWDKGVRNDMERGFGAKGMEVRDGPMLASDWAWPMTGSYVWAAGRWVYDCSRTTNQSAIPQMMAMINPCKAIATARWQAFQFAENELAVPAIQFMFVTCRSGGYIDYPNITDQDYEFILDLPQIEVKRAPFPIGNTDKFDHNTIVLRPRLLKHVEQLKAKTHIEPVIEVIRPEDPEQPPSQVKVKVPLSKLPADSEACGFMLSLGWFDTNGEQSKKVKKCSVKVTHFSGRRRVRDSIVQELRNRLGEKEKLLKDRLEDKVGDIEVIFGIRVRQIPVLRSKLPEMATAAMEAVLDFLASTSPFEGEEWLFRIGVNGAWRSRYIGEVRQREEGSPLKFSPPLEFKLLLSKDDELSTAVNGAEFDAVGSMMRERAGARMLTVDKKEPTWSAIVDASPELRQKMVLEYVFGVLRRGPSGLGLGLDNQPLGFLDPFLNPIHMSTSALELTVNPILIGRAGNASQAITKEPFFARAIGDQELLYEDLDTSNGRDYGISYDLTVADQVTAEASKPK